MCEINKISTLQTWDTTFTADCVDFCPIENFEHLFLVGTYQLDSKSDQPQQTRVGKLCLFKTDQCSMTVCQEIPMAGILDARWSPRRIYGMILLAIANAEGHLLIYALDQVEVRLNLHKKIDICSPALALYVDWSFQKQTNNSEDISLVTSDSNGSIHIYNLSENDIHQSQSVKAHDYESWIAIFDYWNNSVVYSGGDDSKFCGFDLRTDCLTKIFTNKEHDAGVTTIQSSLDKPSVLYTGSYDEHLRVWDIRHMRRAVSTHKIGGGVWRLRCHPTKIKLILASCMHEGFKIIDIENDFKVISEYNHHQSLAYGADWSRIQDGHADTIASVSFYDHLLCLWKFHEEK